MATREISTVGGDSRIVAFPSDFFGNDCKVQTCCSGRVCLGVCGVYANRLCGICILVLNLHQQERANLASLESLSFQLQAVRFARKHSLVGEKIGYDLAYGCVCECECVFSFPGGERMVKSSQFTCVCFSLKWGLPSKWYA